MFARNSKGHVTEIGKRSGLALTLSFLLASCAAAPYDRYIEEGKRLRSSNAVDKAKQSFHKAVLAAQAQPESEPKKKKRLIEALQAEEECAEILHQNDEAVSLLAEEVQIMAASGEPKRASVLQKQMGILVSKDNPAKAMAYFKAALETLKTGGFEISAETADVLASIADLKLEQNDLDAALDHLESACTILDKIKYHSNDHAHAVYLYKLANIYQQLNRDNESIEAQEKAKALELTGINDSISKQPRM